jgi:hypothetical protein
VNSYGGSTRENCETTAIALLKPRCASRCPKELSTSARGVICGGWLDGAIDAMSQLRLAETSGEANQLELSLPRQTMQCRDASSVRPTPRPHGGCIHCILHEGVGDGVRLLASSCQMRCLLSQPVADFGLSYLGVIIVRAPESRQVHCRAPCVSRVEKALSFRRVPRPPMCAAKIETRAHAKLDSIRVSASLAGLLKA